MLSIWKCLIWSTGLGRDWGWNIIILRLKLKMVCRLSCIGGCTSFSQLTFPSGWIDKALGAWISFAFLSLVPNSGSYDYSFFVSCPCHIESKGLAYIHSTILLNTFNPRDRCSSFVTVSIWTIYMGTIVLDSSMGVLVGDQYLEKNLQKHHQSDSQLSLLLQSEVEDLIGNGALC